MHQSAAAGPPAGEGAQSVQIKISARHGHVSEPTQEFIREKAQKLTRLFERLTIIEVTVDLKNEGQTWVEFLVKSEHKHDFVAHESHPDLLAAVDLALAKIEMQVRRHKEKLQDRRRTPSAGEVAGTPPAAETGEQ
jgi:putative sigma-54 modulation protein